MCDFRCRIPRRLFCGFLCVVHNTCQHKANIRKCHAVAPHFIFCGIRIRVFLLFRLRFCRSPHDFAMSFKDLRPVCDIYFGRIFCAEIIAPPIGESLQSCTFRWSKPADNVLRFFRYGRRIFIIGSHQRIRQIFFRFGMVGVLLVL